MPADLPDRCARHRARASIVQAIADFFATIAEERRRRCSVCTICSPAASSSRATVFALGIMPYISASIFQQIAQAVIPQVDKMQKDEEGRKKITQWTRYATVVLAAVQAWGFALFAESSRAPSRTPASASGSR